MDLVAVPLIVPSLRDRREDAALVAHACWERVAPGRTLHPDALEVVSAYPWPRNVRQLQAFVLRLATSCADTTVRRGDAERALHLEAGSTDEPQPIGLDGDTAHLPSFNRDEVAEQVQALGLPQFLDAFEECVIRWALGKTSGSRKPPPSSWE